MRGCNNAQMAHSGPVAKWSSRLPVTQEIAGSNPVGVAATPCLRSSEAEQPALNRRVGISKLPEDTR